MKSQMNSLLNALGNTPALTYVGVGSAIHDLPGLSPKSDQIIPVFVGEAMLAGQKVTAIHFDPMFNFDVMDALEKLLSLGLVMLEAGKGYRVACKPAAYLDTAHPRWIEFFHSFLRVPPPPAT